MHYQIAMFSFSVGLVDEMVDRFGRLRTKLSASIYVKKLKRYVDSMGVYRHSWLGMLITQAAWHLVTFCHGVILETFDVCKTAG